MPLNRGARAFVVTASGGVRAVKAFAISGCLLSTRFLIVPNSSIPIDALSVWTSMCAHEGKQSHKQIRKQASKSRNKISKQIRKTKIRSHFGSSVRKILDMALPSEPLTPAREFRCTTCGRDRLPATEFSSEQVQHAHEGFKYTDIRRGPEIQQLRYLTSVCLKCEADCEPQKQAEAPAPPTPPTPPPPGWTGPVPVQNISPDRTETTTQTGASENAGPVRSELMGCSVRNVATAVASSPSTAPKTSVAASVAANAAVVAAWATASASASAAALEPSEPQLPPRPPLRTETVQARLAPKPPPRTGAVQAAAAATVADTPMEENVWACYSSPSERSPWAPPPGRNTISSGAAPRSLAGGRRDRLDTLDAKSLRKAVGAEDVNLVKHHLNQSCDIHGKDGEGKTALHYAARQGSSDIVELLLQACADVNVSDNFGGTPVDEAEHWAIKRLGLNEKYLEVLRILEAQGGIRSNPCDRMDGAAFQRRRAKLESVAFAQGIAPPWLRPGLLALPAPEEQLALPTPALDCLGPTQAPSSAFTSSSLSPVLELPLHVSGQSPQSERAAMPQYEGLPSSLSGHGTAPGPHTHLGLTEPVVGPGGLHAPRSGSSGGNGVYEMAAAWYATATPKAPLQPQAWAPLSQLMPPVPSHSSKPPPSVASYPSKPPPPQVCRPPPPAESYPSKPPPPRHEVEAQPCAPSQPSVLHSPPPAPSCPSKQPPTSHEATPGLRSDAQPPLYKTPPYEAQLPYGVQPANKATLPARTNAPILRPGEAVWL